MTDDDLDDDPVDRLVRELSGPLCYVLNSAREPVPVDVLTWAQWMEEGEHDDRRQVGRAELPGGILSTVFLGVRHFGGLFETAYLAHDGGVDVVQRYWTWEQAAAGHAQELARRTRA